MQIVINIPDKEIPTNQAIIEIGFHFIDGKVCECTYPFKQLPKGHGRLIILSEDAVKREQIRFSIQEWISEVGLSNATVAIIEADKLPNNELENPFNDSRFGG